MTHEIKIRDCTTQRLEIRMRGPGLERLGPPLMTGDGFDALDLPADLDGFLELGAEDIANLPMPDLVGLFVLAVDAGLFGSAGPPEATAAATTGFDRAHETRVWTLDISDTPANALRVLIELLAHADAPEWSIATVGGTDSVPLRPIASLAWPELPGIPDFLSKTHSSQDLGSASHIAVQLRFVAPPPPAVRAELDRVMQIWMSLMLLGGYSLDGDSGGPTVSLDPGEWIDARTWRQDFDLFECVPAAFAPVILYAIRLHPHAPIAGLWILAEEEPPDEA